MKKLKIISLNNYEYQLKDEKDKIYYLNIDFYNIKKPLINDFIYINEKLLNKQFEGYTELFTFGSLEGIYGKKIESIDDEDIIIIEKNNQKLFLKRYYG